MKQYKAKLALEGLDTTVEIWIEAPDDQEASRRSGMLMAAMTQLPWHVSSGTWSPTFWVTAENLKGLQPCYFEMVEIPKEG